MCTKSKITEPYKKTHDTNRQSTLDFHYKIQSILLQNHGGKPAENAQKFSLHLFLIFDANTKYKVQSFALCHKFLKLNCNKKEKNEEKH